MAWHLDSMGWDRYLTLSWSDRWDLNQELNDIIDRSNPDDLGGGRPKHWK